MPAFNYWVLILPLVGASALIGYAVWLVIKELKQSVGQFKTFQVELERTQQIVVSSVPEFQALAEKANEGAEDGKLIVAEVKEVIEKIKATTAVIGALDTTPAREAISYLRERRAREGANTAKDRVLGFIEKMESTYDRLANRSEKLWKKAKKKVTKPRYSSQFAKVLLLIGVTAGSITAIAVSARRRR